MKILFLGRGVVSTQYAWAFEKAGHTVEFYVRKGRKETYGNSVQLEIWDARKSLKGKFVNENWKITLHEEVNPNHDYDLIFVSVNTEQVSSAVDYLKNRVGNATVLFFNNFWQDLKTEVVPIPLNQVVFGFPGAGGGIENNKLRGGFLKTVFIEGARHGVETRIEEVKQLFLGAEFKVSTLKDVRSWLWNHFAINAAMEVELVKCGSFSNMMESPQSLSNIGLNLREIVPVLKAKGAKIDLITNLFAYLPHKFLGFLLGKVVFAPKSLSRKFMVYNNSKPGYALQEVFNTAKKFNVSTPRLKAAFK
ncbi:2-dehydropantoate 2-reductase N-terminal domain-containing protein [Clostridium intestinale]|uniref:ketopantoate reductase family protein n=1 Tax=Clostridium intestinale TaxID=36845 RepID=UPI0028E35CB9|nr:2-dehydropantoate 2-reductase N-terminal domain-containing protein [Clostridium intestinale]